MISVIMPVYNDPEGLRTTLDSLVNQTLSKEKYEILPVDNNSTDNSGDIIKEFENNYPDLVRGLEENEVQSSYAARNKGIEESKGEILVFIDADMWLDENALEKALSKVKDEEEVVFGTKVQPVITEETVFSRYRMKTGAFKERRKNNVVNQRFISTCGMIADRSVFDKTGYFRESIISGGDREFGSRAVENGFKLEYLESVVFYHPLRSSFNSMRKRWIRLGRGRRQLEEEYPEKSLYSNRSEYDLRNYLPTLPHRMSNTIDDWSNLDFKTKSSFYIIYWLDKVYNMKGYWKEKLNL